MDKIVMIPKVVQKSLKFIASQQEQDGSFLSLTSQRPGDFARTQAYKTTFITSQVLGCLNHFSANKDADKTGSKAAAFLLSQKSDLWSFNYWQRHSAEASQMPYPDDLDDTFSALSALWSYDHKIISGKVLHNITRLLIVTEAKTGGPYRTWLTPKSAPKQWLDVDLPVNANVAYFLFLQKVSLPGLAKFFDRAIIGNKLNSIYYPNIYPGVYFLSRFYDGIHKQRLISLLISKRKKNFSWGNPLDTALSVLALINLGHDVDNINRSAEYLIKEFKGGSWPPFAFCLDPVKNGKTYYAGSAALTTAFCMLALYQYQTVHSNKVRANKQDKKQVVLYRKISASLNKRLRALGKEFNDARVLALEKIHKDKLIVLLPWQFYRALISHGEKIDNKAIAMLGQINAYGWIAYTIYDDFLDGEGDPKMLPLANICLREVSVGYKELLADKFNDYQCVKKVLDEIDQANAWEANHCGINISKDGNLTIPKTLPDFKGLSQLANKSLGHALGPIAILLLKGFAQDSFQVKNFTQYFSHYIIARQLNDDAHDWLEDLQSGRLTYVNSLVLKHAVRRNINLKADQQHLRNIFWNCVMPVVARDIFFHTKQARKRLKKMVFLKNSEMLIKLLAPSEQAAKQALIESKKTREYVTAAQN
jgi:hypothetical protein